jgi:hypothetical protein
MMLRSIQSLRNAGTSSATSILLGVLPDDMSTRRRRSEDAEMLLNSRSGRIHLFPLVDRDEEVAFRNFQARGGFLVSACRDSKSVYQVEVQSRRNIPCRLMNPWPGKRVTVREKERAESVPVETDKSNGECLVFSTVAGNTYSISMQPRTYRHYAAERCRVSSSPARFIATARAAPTVSLFTPASGH